MTDRELVTEILSGNRRVLYRFYQEYKPKLTNFIKNRVGQPEDAEEVLADTLFAFLEGLRDFRGSAKISTFLFSIANHKIIDYYRRQKVKHLVFSRAPYLESIVSPFFRKEEESFDAKLLAEKINTVFGRLLPMYRQVLSLKYLEDLSVEAIALRLSISFKSAESRLFRARKAFVETFRSL